MIAFKGHFDGKVIVLDEPVDLPKGQALLVRVEVAKKAQKVKKGQKPKKGGKPKKKGTTSVFEWLEKNAVQDDGLPSDLAHQHDHYLYGTPKKPTSPE
jgi:hypothetical protein